MTSDRLGCKYLVRSDENVKAPRPERSGYSLFAATSWPLAVNR